MTQQELKLRPLACELSLLSRADGSASFCFGDETFVVGCVYGPTDVRISKEKIDRATIEVLVKPKVGNPSCATKLKEEIIRNSIDASVIGSLHPRSAINVIIQEVQGNGLPGGSMLAASINAACLALLDGGVPMRSMFAAVSCACVKRQGQTNELRSEEAEKEEEQLELIVDPSEEQELEAKAVLTFAFESSEKKLVASHFSGQSGGGGVGLKGVLSDKKLQECLSLCSQAAEEIFKFYRDCIKQKMSIDSTIVAKSNLVTVTGQAEQAEKAAA